MALVIDTAQIRPADRLEAVRAATSKTEVPHLLTPTDGDVHHRLEVWEVGPGCSLIELQGSSSRLVRGPRQLRVEAPARVSLGLTLNSTAGRSHLGVAERFAVGDLFLTDLTSAHVYGWAAGGSLRSFNVDYASVGLAVEVIRRAIPQLRQSPLYSLVQRHLSELTRVQEGLSGSRTAGMLGAATTELLRALVITAVDGDPAGQRQVLEETLLFRVKHHIERHLTESTLDARSIASAHNVSVRRLYQVWQGSELSLRHWIIRARLEGARRELARPGPGSDIAAVAHRWAFGDPAHFSRRFRAEYGMSPREWQNPIGPATTTAEAFRLS